MARVNGANAGALYAQESGNILGRLKIGKPPGKIAKELGMEPDEVLRLKQITGLAELFADTEFSEAWEMSEENAL